MANLQAQKPKFSMIIKSDVYQNLIKQTLGDPKKAERYTAAIMSAQSRSLPIKQNTLSLQKDTPKTALP